MKKTNGKTLFLTGLFLTVILLAFSGCGAGNADSTSNSGSGSYSLSVAWPGQEETVNENSRIIPDSASTIQVTITGEWIPSSSPIITSVSSGTTTLTIENIPVGSKVALIKALDSSGNLTAQRKESFTLTDGQTITADSVPLGVAITGDTSSPVFEPSNISIPYGKKLYVQNWLSQEVTYRSVNDRNGTVNSPISGISTASNGATTFSEASTTLYPHQTITIPANSKSLAVTSPIVSYTETNLVDFFTKTANDGAGGITFQYMSHANNHNYVNMVGVVPAWDTVDPCFGTNRPAASYVPLIGIRTDVGPQMIQMAPSTSVDDALGGGDPVMRVKLNGSYGSVNVTGSVKKLYTDGDGCVFYIYKGAANYSFGSPNNSIWQCTKAAADNTETTFNLDIPYSPNEELFFAVNAKANGTGDVAFWNNLHFKAVK